MPRTRQQSPGSANDASPSSRVPTAVGSAVYVTPRTTAPAPDANGVRVRVVRQADGLLVHVTAATPELAESVVTRLFGPDQAFVVELCG